MSDGAELMPPITYISEQPKDYAKALAAADTLEKLRATAGNWKPLAEDAYKIVMEMRPSDFKAWRKGLAKEQKGIFAGEKFAKRYRAVSMPEAMFKVTMMAVDYSVPWGLMYLRLKENGQLEKALGK